MYDEALRFYTKYFTLYPHIQHRMWDPNEMEANNNEVLERWRWFKRLSMVELQGIHEHDITNYMATNGLYMCVFHVNMLKSLLQTHLHHDLYVHNINVHM
jgi:hypothetical protein